MSLDREQLELRRAAVFAEYRRSRDALRARASTPAERFRWLEESIELLRDYLPPRDGSDARVTYDSWGTPHSEKYLDPDAYLWR